MIRKNVKKYIGILTLVALVIAGAVGLTPTAQAAANDITFAVETTLIVGGHTLYVLTGGTAASYSIGASSVSFYMEDGSSITVRSLAKKVLNTSLSNTYACASTFSMASRVSTATETFTITPTDTVCSITAGGGGGTAASSGGTTTPIVQTPAVVITTPTPVVTPAPVVTPVATTPAVISATPIIQITSAQQFVKRLSVGSKGSDVQQLQEMLLNDGVYPEGLVTGYFGSLTRNAVRVFQEKYGIANQGDPGYGDVGPNTRAKLNEIVGSGSSSVATSAQSAVNTQLQTQIQSLQEQLVMLLAELAKQLQSQVQ